MGLTAVQRSRIEVALRLPNLPAGLRKRLTDLLRAGAFIGNPNDAARDVGDLLSQAHCVAANDDAKRQADDLDRQHGQLVEFGGGGIATADEILANGRQGLAFFGAFLPSYQRCAALFETVPASMDELTRRYESESGLSMQTYRGDGTLVAAAYDELQTVNDELDDCGMQLGEVWSGAAAMAGIEYYRRFSLLADQLRGRIGDASRAVGNAMATLESVIFDKARSVHSLYVPTISGLNPSRITAVVDVALGSDVGWATMMTWFGFSPGRGERGRRAAADFTQLWLINGHQGRFGAGFKEPFEDRFNIFVTACDSCERSVQRTFARLEEALARVPARPFAAMPGRIGAPLPPLTPAAALRDSSKPARHAAPDQPGRNAGPGDGSGSGAGSASDPGGGPGGGSGGGPGGWSDGSTNRSSRHGDGPSGRGAEDIGSVSDAAAPPTMPPAWQAASAPTAPAGTPSAIRSGSGVAATDIGTIPAAAVGTDTSGIGAALPGGAGGPSSGSSAPTASFGVVADRGGDAGHSIAANVNGGAEAAGPSSAADGVGTPHHLYGVDAIQSDASHAESGGGSGSGSGVSGSGGPGGLPALGMPMGALGRSQGNRDALRKYPIREDLVGEDDLAEWARLGPVIGESKQ